MPTVDDKARTFRDKPLGKVLILAVVLIAALVVARSCGKTETKVSQDQAIAIAKQEITFEPNHVMVRIMKQGLKSRPFWAVSMSIQQETGALDNLTVVVVDANTGEVTQIRRQVP